MAPARGASHPLLSYVSTPNRRALLPAHERVHVPRPAPVQRRAKQQRQGVQFALHRRCSASTRCNRATCGRRNLPDEITSAARYNVPTREARFHRSHGRVGTRVHQHLLHAVYAEIGRNGSRRGQLAFAGPGSRRTTRRARTTCVTRTHACLTRVRSQQQATFCCTEPMAVGKIPRQGALLQRDDGARGAQQMDQGRAVLLLRRDRGAQDHLRQGQSNHRIRARPTRACVTAGAHHVHGQAVRQAGRPLHRHRAWRSSASNTSSSRPSTATSARSITSHQTGCGERLRGGRGRSSGPARQRCQPRMAHAD